MATGVSSPARPSSAYLHGPLSHTNNNSSNFTSDSSNFAPASLPTSKSSTNYSSPLLSSNDLSRRRPSLSPHNSASATSTTSSLACSPLLESSPADSASSSATATASAGSFNNRSRPQPLSVSSFKGDPRTQKPGGFLAFAASAIDRTQSAIATISDPKVRHQRSLSRLSIAGDFSAHSLGAEPSPDRTSKYRPSSTLPSPLSSALLSPLPGSKSPISQTLLEESPYSQPYSETDPSQPPPIILPRSDDKMHQTSSRLLRMTDDDRPFTKVSRKLLALIRFSSTLVHAWPVTGAAPLRGDNGMPRFAAALTNSTCRTSKTFLQP